MDLYQLRYFVVLAEELSFTRAAARCFVSQQALSRAIAKLEHHVGVRLVDRTPRGCSLTWAGRALMPEARDILARAGRLQATLTGAHRPGRDFVVGLHDEGLAELTPIVCAAFRERHPEIRLILQTLPYTELPDAVRNRRVDAQFCLADTVGDRARFTAVFDDQPVLLIRTGDAIAAASVLAAEDVLDRVFVAAGDYLPGHFYAPFSLGSLRNGEPAREIDLPSPDNLADGIRQIVDDGAVIVTNASLARFATSPAATCVPLTGSPAFTFGVASGVTAPELQESLVELATSAASTDLDAIVTALTVPT